MEKQTGLTEAYAKMGISDKNGTPIKDFKQESKVITMWFNIY